MLKVREVAERLQVHEQTVYRWIYAGRLKALKIKGLVRITEEEFARFIGGK